MDNYLVSEFISISSESLRALDPTLAKLEQNPSDRQALERIYQTVHTIRGTCGFLGLPRIESVANASETLLDALRSGRQQSTRQAAGLVMQQLACMRGLIDYLGEHDREPEGDDSALLALQDEAPAMFPDLPSAPVSAADFQADLTSFFKGNDELNALLAEFGAQAEEEAEVQVRVLPQPKETVRVVSQTPARQQAGGQGAVERLSRAAAELIQMRGQLMQAMQIPEGSDFLLPALQIPVIAEEIKEQIAGQGAATSPAKSRKPCEADFLLFAIGQGAPKAVPLELVLRLERFDVRQVETAAGVPVVQYRGSLLQLTCFNPSQPIPAEGVLQTVVLQYDNRMLGMVVDRVIDIAKAPYDIKIASAGKGLLGSMLIAGRVTDMVDVAHLFARIFAAQLRRQRETELAD